jgi:hypothetical protein
MYFKIYEVAESQQHHKNKYVAKNISTALVLTRTEMEWSSTLMAKLNPTPALIIKRNQKYTPITN